MYLSRPVTFPVFWALKYPISPSICETKHLFFLGATSRGSRFSENKKLWDLLSTKCVEKKVFQGKGEPDIFFNYFPLVIINGASRLFSHYGSFRRRQKKNVCLHKKSRPNDPLPLTGAARGHCRRCCHLEERRHLLSNWFFAVKFLVFFFFIV